MKVKYHGKSFGGGYTGLTDGKEYVCLGVEYDLLRIVDDEGEDYLYSASAPAPQSSPKDGGKREITEDTDNVLKTVIGNNEWNGYKGKVLNEVQSYGQFFL